MEFVQYNNEHFIMALVALANHSIRSRTRVTSSRLLAHGCRHNDVASAGEQHTLLPRQAVLTPSSVIAHENMDDAKLGMAKL